MPGDDVRDAKERGWREMATVDAAHSAGDLDDVGWHDAVRSIVEAAYLAADNPRAQSGHSGDETRWETARRLLVDAIPGDCTFLDIGCANGHLMECLAAWAAADGIQLEPYGVEISPALAELARKRLPHWADRIWTGNANRWEPPRRFDVVRTGLDYVPADRRASYVEHLLSNVVAPDGRLVIGVFNEEREYNSLADDVESWGFRIAGRTHRPHAHPELAYKAFWIDATNRSRQPGLQK